MSFYCFTHFERGAILFFILFIIIYFLLWRRAHRLCDSDGDGVDGFANACVCICHSFTSISINFTILVLYCLQAFIFCVIIPNWQNQLLIFISASISCLSLSLSLSLHRSLQNYLSLRIAITRKCTGTHKTSSFYMVVKVAGTRYMP